MKQFHRASHVPKMPLRSGLKYLAAALGLFCTTATSFADLDSMNMDVWKLLFGVTPAQAADNVWLAADTDGDGFSNAKELATGTNPFSPAKAIKVSKVVLSGGNAELDFPTESGKRYRAQCTSSISSPTWLIVTSGPTTMVNGSGGTMTLSVTHPGDCFYRILVDDVDADSDGLSDWAEHASGFDPNNPTTNGSPDAAALTAAIANSNVVSVAVTRSSATQPADAMTAAVESGSIVISRAGILKFNPITIPLQKSGTALEGADYDSLPASVTLTAGVPQVVLTINPKHYSARRTNVTATVKVLAGANYTLGATTSGSVLINPPGLSNGTGLTGYYQNQGSSTYSTQAPYFETPPEMTRVDPVIDFSNRIASVAVGNPGTITTVRPHELSAASNVRISGVTGGTFNGGSTTINATLRAVPTGANTFYLQNTAGTTNVNCTVVPTSLTASLLGGTNGWDSATGPVGLSTAAAGGSWSVRWIGQVLPKYSERYYFDFRSDDGAKVWVNGKLLIDRWFSQGATDYVNWIALKAGVLYDIKIEYFSNAGASPTNAEARLYWWSLSQPKEIVPQSRLFPEPTLANKFTAITSALKATGYVGVPFSFALTSTITGGTTTYALSADSGPLPLGLTLDPATGVISGTPSVAGKYNVAINSTNAAAGAPTGSTVVDITIFPTGSITRETLAGNGAITADGTIPALDDDTDYPDNTSRRLRGYFVPPKTGNYYFWLAASSSAELYLSNDFESVNRVRRATVASNTGKKVWNVVPAQPQQSQWLALVEGERYYIEVLHNTGTEADDFVNVGWLQDDVGTVLAVTGAANPTGATPQIPDGGAALQGYPFSGTMPSHVFQPYDYPNVTPSDGALYAANMGPQTSAQTSASGSVNLRVNAAGTQAILYFNYQGLGSPRTAYHLHVDGYTGMGNVLHQAGEIIYDIDDADFFNTKTADGGYIWDFAPSGSFGSIAQILEAITLGKVYLNVHSVTYPNGEIRGTLQKIDGSQTPPVAGIYAEPTATDLATTDAGAARFLNQATFGASPTDIAYVKANGFEAWIDDQLTKTPGITSNDVVAGISADINQPFPSTLFTNTWWKYSITSPDQLRQRVAFALSEILVVSWQDNVGPLRDNGRILADYYDNLLVFGLPTPGVTDSGNFRGVLKGVTLTPAMGLFLDMRGNQKGDITIGRHPNENYAREIKQLFSIGLFRMWDDGKFVLGTDAGLVPTYSQPSILGLSALLTGWNYAQNNQGNGRAPSNFGPAADYLNPMVLVPARHELASKLLLNNVVSPGATGLTPRVTVTNVSVASPSVITSSTPHGLSVGDTVRIANIGGGAFTPSTINAVHQVTKIVSDLAFEVGINCTSGTGLSYVNAVATGPTVLSPTFSSSQYALTSSVVPVTGSQADTAGTGANHPYDLYGLKELEIAIDNIVQNDATAPFICRRLIQRLTTSDPSPGYVYRVVQKFKNNGSGVRGDMAAVVKQILLDGEARSYGLPQGTFTTDDRNAFGKQREPMLRLTGPARAFPANPYTGTYTQLTGLNAHKLRITTSNLNDFSAGFTVNLNFRGNYTTTNPPSPYSNPTSTNYSVASTSGIASTHTEISSITPGSPTVITTATPHGLTTGNTVTCNAVSGTFVGTSINTAQLATVIDATSFSIPINSTRTFQVVSVSTGNPCTITTAAPHGLPVGTSSVTFNGITGGTFSPAINATFTATYSGADPNTFTVPSNCTVAPTSITLARHVSNPCKITTVEPHGLSNGTSITITLISGGTFSPSPNNNSFAVTVVDGNSFTIPVNCTAAATVNTGSIVGGLSLDVAATGMVNVSYSQPAGSNILTVNTSGPQTDVNVPGTTVSITSISTGNPCTVTTSANHNLVTGGVVSIAGITDGTFPAFPSGINGSHVPTVIDSTSFTIPVNCTDAPTPSTGTTAKLTRSRVYLMFINQTAAGGAVIATDGIHDVRTRPSGSSFTVFTPDTPATARGGFVIVPKISTSYTPTSNKVAPIVTNSVVVFNTNVNHNFQAGDLFWADVPVVGSPLIDAEYIVPARTVVGVNVDYGIDDEDHVRVSYLPAALNGGTYPKPSGSNNGVTLYPLVPPPLGRSGNVTINQSTFNLGGTDGSLTQSPLNAPTVFNYYFSDYKFPGVLANGGVDSPEFQLTTDTNVVNLTNSIVNMIIGTGGGNSNVAGLSSFSNGNSSVVIDIAPYVDSTAEGAIPGLVDQLADLLIGAPLTTTTRNAIINFVNHKNGSNVLDYLPYTTPTPLQKRDRARAIIHLIITSAEYAVQK
ncbi:MAG: DUF1800 family protein [Chthoniobacteraceae bacterium]